MKLPIYTRICLNEYDMETGNNQAGNLVLDKDGVSSQYWTLYHILC